MKKEFLLTKQAQPWNLKVPLKWSISPSKQFFNTTGSDQSNQFPQLRYSMNLKWSLPAAMKLLPLENNFSNKGKYVCLCIQLHLFWQWPWKENPPNIYIDQINAKIIFMVKSNKDCVYLLLAQGKITQKYLGIYSLPLENVFHKFSPIFTLFGVWLVVFNFRFSFSHCWLPRIWELRNWNVLYN